MPFGEVFLGAFVTVLLERLASHALLKFLRPAGIDAQLEKWHQTLLIIKAVLTDAENKQSMNEAVKEWLKNLEDLAYDLDDMVDELNTKALLKLTENKASTSTVRKLIPTCCTNLSLTDFKFDNRITSKINEIGNRLEDLDKQIGRLSLVQNVMGMPYRKPERLQMTSLVLKSEVLGREKEKEDILNMLLEIDQSLTVIPIVGMGGVGKTTLAQLVYNDEKLEGEFDIKAWACVSDEFDALKITKIILDHVSFERCDYVDLNMLQVKLKKNLSNKKFLIVLDDVWNEKYGDWDILRRPFLAGKPGSKIVVTTRQQKVAQMMSPCVRTCHLNELSEADALALLAQHALEAKDFDVLPHLTQIGKSVVRRCKNLPLAVKAIGGILRTKTSVEEWEGVLNSEIWTSEEKCDILPALKLSYHCLPPHLKQCFAYCAIYPKDYEFDKTELVYLWMAEGFLQQTQQERLMEELGADYFDELLSRSFFQKSTSNASRFVMHDLINDLSTFVSGCKCLRLEDIEKDDLRYKNSGKPRHFSFIPRLQNSYDRFSSVSSFQSLRSFLALSDIYFQSCYLNQRVLCEILLKLYSVREISLSGNQIYELPENIGDLRHLRYFNLSGNRELRCLPQSVSKLCNLEVLILEGCENLVKLPAHIENLISIRHLNIANTLNLNEMPLGISKLTSLQTLSKMIVSKSDGLKISDLKDFSRLKGEISICDLQNVVNVQEAIDSRLKNKSRLNEIRLIWSCESDDSRSEVLELDVLEALKPHEMLSSLEIKFYGGAKFSSWIENLSSFSMLTKLNFECCKRCTSLPKLGQLPLLRDLRIQGMDGVKVIGTEFYGNVHDGESVFPSLENVTFEDMPEWEEWHGLTQSTIEFPKLSSLQMRRCPKLVMLPFLSFPSLRELSMESCNEVILNQTRNLASLTDLKLKRIFGLTSISRTFEHFPLKLENLVIHECEDLVTLWASDNLLRRVVNLRSVQITRCPKLLSIQEIGVFPILHTQEDSSSLDIMTTTTTLKDCSTSLGYLQIQECPNLNLRNVMGSLQSYSNLSRLSIWSCNGLELFPQGGLPTPNLKFLDIAFCPNLKALPDRIEQLSSLVSLWVQHCPSLMEPFPQGNLPQNLTYLTISYVEKLKPLGQWKLQNLTFLTYFSLDGGYPEVVSFAEDHDNDQRYLLPPSLTDLSLCGMPNLENSKGFENLTSLTTLSISGCPKLVELPMGDQLHKLSGLYIYNCPLIEKRCLKNRGDYWPIIVDIPVVKIHYHGIHDPYSKHKYLLPCIPRSIM